MTPVAPPPCATDCHVHVFDPARFPYAAARRYTPPPAPVAALQRLHARLGIERVVLVQPSVYGSDNACLLDALAQLGPCARGVAVVDATCSRGHLEDLWGAGVRGVRLNLQVDHATDAGAAATRMQGLAQQLDGLPLCLQLHASLPLVLAGAALLQGLGRPVLLDHFALAPPGDDAAPRVERLCALLQAGNLWVKLSGPHHISTQAPGYADVAPLARTLLQAAPGRVVWGSDWPHTGGVRRGTAAPDAVEPFRAEDDARLLQLAVDWAGDDATRQALFVDNAARLFGFAGPLP